MKQLGSPTDINIATYKRYRNHLNKWLHKTERDYYHNQLDEYKSDLKNSWNILKRVVNRNIAQKAPDGFEYNETSTNKLSIANKFHDFIVNIGPNLAKEITRTNKY